MNKMKWTRIALMASLLMMVSAMATQATVLRAFVSSTGSDGNAATNCAQTAPCKTFNGAFPVVTAGGELVALDTSGYGALTINKAITILAIPGATAFVVAGGGTSGFTISAGATEMVKLRNINFNGSNAANTTGITHNSGKLIVENCTFQQLTIGVDNFAKMDLIDCDLHGNGTAVQSTGQGTLPDATVAVAQVRINRGNITFNTVGIRQVSAGLNGNNNPLFNVFVFALSSGTLNLAGNTTNSNCSGASCASGPGIYTMGGL
jgi:hypothetical protein